MAVSQRGRRAAVIIDAEIFSQIEQELKEIDRKRIIEIVQAGLADYKAGGCFPTTKSFAECGDDWLSVSPHSLKAWFVLHSIVTCAPITRAARSSDNCLSSKPISRSSSSVCSPSAGASVTERGGVSLIL